MQTGREPAPFILVPCTLHGLIRAARVGQGAKLDRGDMGKPTNSKSWTAVGVSRMEVAPGPAPVLAPPLPGNLAPGPLVSPSESRIAF